MKIKQDEFQLNSGESLAEPIARALHLAAKDQLTDVMQQLQSFSQSAIRRGEEVAADYRAELKAMQRNEPHYMPLDLRVNTGGKSEAFFKANWIRKPYVSQRFGPQPEAKYKVNKATHTTSMYYITKQCPAAFLPIVEKTEARLTQVREELNLTTVMLRSMSRLLKLHELECPLASRAPE